MNVMSNNSIKKKVLFLSREFQHPNNACGICLYNLALELINRGCEIYVISLVPQKGVFKYDTCFHVTELHEDRFTTLCNIAKSSCNYFVKVFYKIIQFFRLIIVTLSTPNTAPLKSREIYKVAKHIVLEQGIDMVIGSYSPYETNYASVLLKKWRRDLKVLNYHLDPLLMPGNSIQYISRYKRKRANSAVISELGIVDKLLVPETFYEEYPKSDKVCPVGFPLYKMKSNLENTPYNFNPKFINVVYVGTLDSTNRNIAYTLKLIDSLAKSGLNIQLHIWGSLLDNETRELIQNCRYADYHGLINSNLVPSLLATSNILLNVCNFTYYSSLPSKIFQLFASQKPILVIKRNSYDTSLPYFVKYGNVYFAEEGNLSKELVSELKNFIISSTSIIHKSNKDIFFKYTPQYICDQINC